MVSLTSQWFLRKSVHRTSFRTNGTSGGCFPYFEVVNFGVEINLAEAELQLVFTRSTKEFSEKAMIAGHIRKHGIVDRTPIPQVRTSFLLLYCSRA